MSHWLDVVREPNHRDIMRRQSLQDRPNTTQASASSNTITIGNCACTTGVGVVAPTVTSLFAHKQCYRWSLTGLKAALNAKDGFTLTAEPVAVWNTDSPSNSWISADITRTVGADSDIYVLTVTEDSSFGWKANVSIKSGATANCPDEIDWTWVCSTPLSPPANMSTFMVLYGLETKKSEDNTDELTYLDPPGCGMCLVPASGGTCVSGICLEDYRPESLAVFSTSEIDAAGTSVQVLNPAGDTRYITRVNAVALFNAALSVPVVMDCATESVHYSLSSVSDGHGIEVAAGTNTDGSGTQETLVFDQIILAGSALYTCLQEGLTPTGRADFEFSVSQVYLTQLDNGDVSRAVQMRQIDNAGLLEPIFSVGENLGLTYPDDYPLLTSALSPVGSQWFIFSGAEDAGGTYPANTYYLTVSQFADMRFAPV